MTIQAACNDCGAALFDQRYLKCGGCLRKIGVVPLMSPVPPRIDWKEAARQYRHLLKLSETTEVTLKRKLWVEHDKRARLATTMADILMGIAYDENDTSQEYCNVCRRSLIEEDSHQAGCLYVLALAALAEAGRSVEA
jgi:hypothetical protein